MTIDTPPRVDRTRWKLRSSKAESSDEEAIVTPAPPALPARRNPKWIALGVVALCLGALLSFVIYSRVSNEVAVVALVHTVHRGGTLTAADLTTVTLGSGAGVEMVPASQLDGLVGQQAVYDLVAGSILPVGAVAQAVIPQTGRAVVGVRLVTGRAPTGLLTPGSPVRLIALPPEGVAPGFKDAYTGRTIIAREINQTDGADGASIVINVDVPANQAPVVALLAAQERLAVVRDADK